MPSSTSSSAPAILKRLIEPLRSRRGATFALVFGIVTHTIFTVAVVVIILGLYSGLQTGRGPFEGWAAVFFNALLLVQFPVAHSFLLSKPGRAMLAKLAPYGVGRDLAPTTFVLVASLQLLATFTLWSPSGITIGNAASVERHIFQALFLASWVFLIKALTDSGLGLQTGYVGWSSVVKGKRPDYGGFPERGLFRLIRHPVYLGFALVMWTSPVHTLDGIVLASCWTAYCLTAPLLKESRFREWYGERYVRYQAAVPYMLPRFRR